MSWGVCGAAGGNPGYFRLVQGWMAPALVQGVQRGGDLTPVPAESTQAASLTEQDGVAGTFTDRGGQGLGSFNPSLCYGDVCG